MKFIRIAFDCMIASDRRAEAVRTSMAKRFSEICREGEHCPVGDLACPFVSEDGNDSCREIEQSDWEKILEVH